MVIHDFICLRCDKILRNLPSRANPPLHHNADSTSMCRGKLVIYWSTTTARPAQFCTDETTVVYYSDQENKVQYPMLNNVPIPPRLVARGYRKLELKSDHAVGQFEKKHNVVNERRHYDSNGRGYEDE
jgi:hypothetical protein